MENVAVYNVEFILSCSKWFLFNYCILLNYFNFVKFICGIRLAI